jgi:small subunit ribosomal protein S15
MPLAVEVTKEIIGNHAIHSDDTGSSEVQISLLTRRIADLTEHLKEHKKDFASRRGMFQMVSRRRSLLRYLRGKNPVEFTKLLKTLGIRG